MYLNTQTIVSTYVQMHVQTNEQQERTGIRTDIPSAQCTRSTTVLGTQTIINTHVLTFKQPISRKYLEQMYPT